MTFCQPLPLVGHKSSASVSVISDGWQLADIAGAAFGRRAGCSDSNNFTNLEVYADSTQDFGEEDRFYISYGSASRTSVSR
jgi:hypothetical protein